MKIFTLSAIAAALLFSSSHSLKAQAPDLGSAADFVIFTSVGAVTNSGISQLTGNVGTNDGSSTFFGNVNGQMHDADLVSAQCATDLLIAYNTLDTTTADYFPASLLGNGQVLTAGVYSIAADATLNLDLTFDAEGNADAVFIIQIGGPLSTNANSSIHLINGALACNVFWKVEGLVSMASGTYMRGTVIANNAAINMNSNDSLEGRVLSTNGAISIDGVFAYTPIGCGSPNLTGPEFPELGTTACFVVFSSDGPVTNSGTTLLTGDVGTNVGVTSGYLATNVSGNIHTIPDVETAECAVDLFALYTELNTLPSDIELLYPAQFGNNLELTPHTYLMNGATTFTDTLYLNARGNPDAVFIIQINGALSTSTYAKVILTQGAQAKNVFWKVDGAVSINNNSVFNGTIVCNNGSVDITSDVQLNGSAFTTSGSVTTSAIIAEMTTECNPTGIFESVETTSKAAVYPNPFKASINVSLFNENAVKSMEIKLFNALGEAIFSHQLDQITTTLDVSQLLPGVYFYHINSNGLPIQSGQLIAN